MYETICSDYAYLTGRTIKQADRDIKHLVGLIHTYASRGKTVEIARLGVFEVKGAGRMNPKTKEPMVARQVFFRSAAAFKRAIK